MTCLATLGVPSRVPRVATTLVAGATSTNLVAKPFARETDAELQLGKRKMYEYHSSLNTS